jgi:hypothetical protein
MAEGLATADGQVLNLDQSEQAFAAAMAAPRGDEPEHPAPPRRDVDPDAPYGRKVDGSPKKAPGGRPPKARVIEAPRGAERPQEPRKTAAPAADYSEGLSEFFQGVWMAAAAIPMPDGDVRIRVRAQAAVLKANAGGLVQGVNAMAQHNSTIRWGVEKLTMGSAGWVLPAMFAIAPFAVQTAQVWRVPVAGDLLNLAEQTEHEWDEMFRSMQAQMGLAEDQPEAQAA